MARYDPELLTKEQYLTSNVQYGRQAYGLYPEFGGWEDTGVDVEVVGEASDGRENDGPNVLEMVDITSGQPVYDVSYGLPSAYNTSNYKTYDDYLSANNKKDRLSGMFSPKDFEFTKEKAFAGTVGALTKGSPMSLVAGALLVGDTVENAFGNESWRPSGPLGIVSDMVHSRQYDDMASIKAGIAAGKTGGFAMQVGNGGITRGVGALSYTGNMMGLSFEQVKARDAISKGFTPNSFSMSKEAGQTFKEAGWIPIAYSTNEDGVTPGAATGFYTESGNFVDQYGNTSMMGSMNDAQNLADAHGISLQGARSALGVARTGGKTLSEALQDTMFAESGQTESALEGGTTGAGTKAEDFSGIASMTAGVGAYDFKDTYDESYGDTSTPEPGGTTPSTPSAPPSYSDPYESGYGSDNNNDSASDNASDDGGMGVGNMGEGFGYSGGFDLAKGGKVPGYAMGTPPAGVQASQSGFIDAPPSQVSEGAKVADDRPDSVPQGTYILNAAAVEFAGEQDIRKMLIDAQKEAVRRGIVQGDGQRASELIDIAVSSGEVKIAPHLVDIIGEDRLEKINKRGLRKTEERIQRSVVTDSQGRPVTDSQGRPVTSGAARGGFLA